MRSLAIFSIALKIVNSNNKIRPALDALTRTTLDSLLDKIKSLSGPAGSTVYKYQVIKIYTSLFDKAKYLRWYRT